MITHRFFFLVLFLALLTAQRVVSSAVAITSDDDVANANCQRDTYRFTSTANRTIFDLDAMGLTPRITQSQITELFTNFSSELIFNSTRFQKAFIHGQRQVKQTFSISGVYCEPKQKTKRSTLQILVHGVPYDGRYWNFGSQDQNVSKKDYSYAYAAAAQGYSTFRFDRLGTGLSERPQDGYNVAQAPTEVGILVDIVRKAKQSTAIGHQQWDKVVLIGHSYGSAQSQAASVALGDLIDGLVLTGFSTNGQGMPIFFTSNVFTMAKDVFPARFGSAPPAWLTSATVYANQINFVFPETVTKGASRLAREWEQPVTQGSLFTIGNIVRPAASYINPVFVILGEKDLPFALAQANRDGTSLAQETVTQLYPASKNGTSSIVAKTGHGIAIATTAKNTNQEILHFLASNRL